ncbi:MAG: DUF1533 domain-containing protein [Oscillospiraceae bacterium]|jgi:uncharacterized lipoprotein YehR (DUF1307 family)|nr:DUF1533 domain-containing protein [Oscillospiraceae bacterium]
MIKTRKTLALLLAAVMLFALAACGKADDQTPDGGVSPGGANPDVTYVLDDGKLTAGSPLTVQVEKSADSEFTTGFSVEITPHYFGGKILAKITFDESTYTAGGVSGDRAEQFFENHAKVEAAEDALNAQLSDILTGKSTAAVSGTGLFTVLTDALAAAGYSLPAEFSADAVKEYVPDEVPDEVPDNSDELIASLADTDVVYGYMNIPYADFYAAEGVTHDVDAVTTASTSMWTGSLASGSYTTYRGGEEEYGAILGLRFPVKLTAGDYRGIAANIGALRSAVKPVNMYNPDSKAYDIPVVDEWSYALTGATVTAPAAFKTVTLSGGKPQFSKVEGASYGIDESVYTSVHLKVADETQYGEYELDFTLDNDNTFPIDGTGVAGIRNDDGTEVGIKLENGTSENFRIIGVLVKTDGGVYAMRQMENLWWGSRYGLEISWSAGITEFVHSTSVLDTTHYVSTMGETLQSVVFITEKGYFEFEWEQYFPYILDGRSYTLNAESALASGGATAVAVSGLPSDFAAEYSVSGLDGAAVAGGRLTWNAGSAKPGNYTLAATDGSGRYAGITAAFTLTTDATPAAWDGAKLIPADGATADELSAFVNAISNVSVNGKDYSAAGRGATVVINADGTVNLDAGLTTDRTTGEVSGTSIFADSGDYAIVITATGYNKTLEFTFTK